MDRRAERTRETVNERIERIKGEMIKYTESAHPGSPRSFALSDVMAGFDAGNYLVATVREGEELFGSNTKLSVERISQMMREARAEAAVDAVEIRIKDRNLTIPGYPEAYDYMSSKTENLHRSWQIQEGQEMGTIYMSDLLNQLGSRVKGNKFKS